MVMRIRWSDELVTRVDIVPRLEDHLIDELFYQENEIGEMRHTAFMVECGLEEDPPDGPEIEPIPWNEADKAKEELESEFVHDKEERERNGKIRDKKQRQRELPSRSRSTDDIDKFATNKLTSKQLIGRQQPLPYIPSPPRRSRSIAITDSIPSSLSIKEPAVTLSNRKTKKTPKKHPVSRAASNDDIENMELSLAFAKIERPKSSKSDREFRAGERQRCRSNNVNRTLSKTKSGSSHIMERDASKIRTIRDTSIPNKRRPPVRSLIACKSGTLHGMRKTLSKSDKRNSSREKDSNSNRKETRDKKSNNKERVSIVYKNGKKTITHSNDELCRPPSEFEGKNNKAEKISIFFKNGKKTIIRQPSGLSCAQSTSDDDSLDDIVSSDGNTTISSDISISSYEDSSIIDDLFNPVSEKTRPPKVISPSPVTSSPLIGLKKKRRSQRKIVATSNNFPSKDAKFLTISPPALLSKTSNCDTSPSLSSKEEKKNGRKKKSELLDSKKKNEDKIRKKCEIKKVRVNKDKLPSNNHSTKSRPDDWLGSDGKTKRRSWKKKIDIRG